MPLLHPPISLIEEVYCPDIFVSGIGRIEKLAGGMVRIVFYTERPTEGGEVERVIAARIVRPLATWPDAVRLIALAMADSDMIVVADGGRIRAMN